MGRWGLELRVQAWAVTGAFSGLFTRFKQGPCGTPGNILEGYHKVLKGLWREFITAGSTSLHKGFSGRICI